MRHRFCGSAIKGKKLERTGTVFTRLLLLLLAFVASPLLGRAETTVTVRRETVKIPTYTFARAVTLAPLFEIGNRGLYPYTAFDRASLGETPVSIAYHSLILENEYLEVTLLPALGGRIWRAVDKTSGKDLFYHPKVIKPTGYNQRGAWPVGNLEVYGPYDAHMLTWPGEPWAWSIRNHADGSKSVVLSHIDHFFRNKLSMEVTLRPGRSFIELAVKLHNRNPLPNRYLLWTNAGIAASEGTRFIYPMTRTIGHDSAELGSWPVHDGVDLSWYKNNAVMLGVFGLDIYDDFIAAYDYQRDAGTVCYTNRQVARGIKTWTWGVGAAGERHLESYSDSDVPYIEVQSGRFVWDGNYELIGPGKTDGWTEYWYSVAGLGGLTTATRDVALHVSSPIADRSSLHIKLYPTGDFPEATLSWRSGEGVPASRTAPLRAGEVLEAQLPVSGDDPVHLEVRAGGTVLVAHTLYRDGQPRPGELARDAMPRTFGPVENLTAEERFHKGLTLEKLGRIEQAEAAYREALSRDEGYTAPHLRLGLLALERLDPQGAAEHFRRVLERHPAHGDAHYYLAITLIRMERLDEARKELYRLLPSSAKFDQRDYWLGLLTLREGDLRQALPLLASAARTLPTQMSVRQAYAHLLRRSGRMEDARQECEEILEIDSTNAFARAELAFSNGWRERSVQLLDQATGGHAHGYLELATEYGALHAWEEARRILLHAIDAARAPEKEPVPLLFYYAASTLDRLGQPDRARRLIDKASRHSLAIRIFPFRRETVEVLHACLRLVPGDANAASLLGDLYYSRGRHEEALATWEQAIEHQPTHVSSLRNLGWALEQEGRIRQGMTYLQKAVEAAPENLDVATGLAGLYLRLGEKRRALDIVRRALAGHPGHETLLQLMAEISAQNGDYDEALQILTTYRFRPRHQSYELLRLYQAVSLLKSRELASTGLVDEALARIDRAQNPPSSLGVDDFVALESSRLHFFRALIHDRAGNTGKARQAWERAARTSDDDLDGEGLFRALSLARTGGAERAEEWLRRFQEAVEKRKGDRSASVRARAHYLSGIYFAAQGHEEQARDAFQAALEADPSHLFSLHGLLCLESGFFQALHTP